MRSRVAGASTSQKMTSVLGPPSSSTPASSSSSNTPTPLALTTRSASQRAVPSALRRAAFVGGIDDDARPVGVGDVAVLLALVGVGLVEGDLVAARGECADDPAVVGGRAVPVGGDQARAEEGDIQSRHQRASRKSGIGRVSARGRWPAAHRRGGRRCGGRGCVSSRCAASCRQIAGR